MQPRCHRMRKQAARDSHRDRRRTEDLEDERFAEPDWAWVGDRRMFVVGYTSGGAPFGCYDDEFDDLP